MGGRYLLNGFMGTAEEHAARQRQQGIQDPYDAAKPSAGSVNAAARTVNPNLDFNVGPDGNVSASNTSAQARQMAELQARLAADADVKKTATADKNRRDALTALSRSQQAPVAPPVAHAGLGVGMGGEADARAAAFSRAKDQAGRIARSSLTAISERMAGMGTSGGGMQALREAGAITDAAAPLQDLTRDQMISDFNRSADVSDLTYTGGITQRGQDMSQRAAYQALLRSLY